MDQIDLAVTGIQEFVNRTRSFNSSGVELLSIALLFSVKARTIPLIVVENLRNSLYNGRKNILSNGVLLKKGGSIEVLAFQPNCK